jgi:hypothetical protein
LVAAFRADANWGIIPAMMNHNRIGRLSLFLALTIVAIGPAWAQKAEKASREFLVGGSSGLYGVTVSPAGAEIRPLSENLSVHVIVPVSEGWFVLTEQGPVFSPDLSRFETRTAGLPRKTLLVNRNGVFVTDSLVMEISSLAEDPFRPGRLAACGPAGSWYSVDAGKSWTSLGSPSQVPGPRAISFGPLPGTSKIGLWLSHSTKGLFVLDPDYPNAWIPYNNGLPNVFGSNMQEISGFTLIPTANGAFRFIAGLSFLASAYEWDRARASFAPLYFDGQDIGYLESPFATGTNGFSAISGGAIRQFSLGAGNSAVQVAESEISSDLIAAAKALLAQKGGSIDCAALLESGRRVAYNEFWRILPPEPSARMKLADKRRGLYLQTGFVASQAGREKYFGFMKSHGLDMLVIDMKDDYGKLRFTPRSSLLASVSRAGEALDIEAFVAESKKQGIYLVARIVVFKDEALQAWNSGALAVRDSLSGKPWQGLKSDGQPIKEAWVDPYSPEVWKYNVEIAREIRARGFDEVQFDYIRFPTDGENLDRASYPARVEGMNQDSALESFLKYARTTLESPISVDIYGANGWYRTGARTGQDVEMLSKYVDVICPMLYPSHFEQGFLAQAPAELRPYRIYKLGTSRNLAIARGKTLVRPYVQSFYLDVSYDKAYYDARYVREEIRGVREGANQGMTFWNNSGRYDEVPDLR